MYSHNNRRKNEVKQYPTFKQIIVSILNSFVREQKENENKSNKEESADG